MRCTGRWGLVKLVSSTRCPGPGLLLTPRTEVALYTARSEPASKLHVQMSPKLPCLSPCLLLSSTGIGFCALRHAGCLYPAFCSLYPGAVVPPLLVRHVAPGRVEWESSGFSQWQTPPPSQHKPRPRAPILFLGLVPALTFKPRLHIVHRCVAPSCGGNAPCIN
ncbi:Terminal uridylyltransferase 4 [Clarias magur]|uniref:Terminal uridylyltransferase 4 n=1 Tax=Clarias magur TaxID=1594786 RepID=A0A8J4UFC5_CLAMG|nr:Terminal uridylyltransferase 4 [Clarias magur]